VREGEEVHEIKIGKGLGDVSESTLRFCKQVGVEAVSMPTRWSEQTGKAPGTRLLVPKTQTGPSGRQPDPWDRSELLRIRERIESFDLIPEVAGLPLSGNILLGREGRDQDIENVITCIEIAGEIGLKVLTYNFTALRASKGYAARIGGGRGGSDLRDFDNDRIADLPPLENVGSHSVQEIWERIEWFLKAVVPVAESAGIRLAVHPNDPPVPEYRGVAQPLSDLDGLKRLIETVDSPSNSLFFDTGVTTEIGEDAAEAIRYFGGRGRIAHVHFRNARVEIPRYKYVETFLDEGDCNMHECMNAFKEVGYTGLLDPDHTPGITEDTPDTRIGWAFAIGQIISLRNSVY
jgi:mannonate dehydratase